MVVVFCKTIDKGAPELGLMLVLGGGVCILFLVADGMLQTMDGLKRLAQLASLDSALLTPVLKTVAISVTTRITAEMCRSGGEGGVASFVEFAGVVLSLVIALPLVEGVLAMLGEML